jgi:hypothetical protein
MDDRQLECLARAVSSDDTDLHLPAQVRAENSALGLKQPSVQTQGMNSVQMIADIAPLTT